MEAGTQPKSIRGYRTLEATGRQLGKTAEEVRELIEHGPLVGREVGGELLVHADDLDAYLSSSRKGAAAPASTGADEPRWTVAKVAAFLAVSPAWVYLRVASGEIPSLRYGSNVRFDPDVVRRYSRGELPPAPPKLLFFKNATR